MSMTHNIKRKPASGRQIAVRVGVKTTQRKKQGSK